MTQLAEAIIKIQDYLNNQQKRGQKSYYNNSSYSGQSPRMQPLTEEGLAKRLGVSEEREQCGFVRSGKKQAIAKSFPQ
ncbi:hypothetical protein FD724_37325 (plasmid) [Nostoc sp. C057]|nr:hypothetical protein FD724_37325 [Nostoc sp. C057]